MPNAQCPIPGASSAPAGPEIIPGLRRVWLPYDSYVASNGDILLWEAHSATGCAIALETGGPFVHASGVVKLRGRPWQAAYQEGLNGYLSPLSAEVRRHSGKISIFRPFDPDSFAGGMPRHFGPDVCDRVSWELESSLGGDYAWVNIGLIFAGKSRLARLAAYLPLIGSRLLARWQHEVALQSHRATSAICSQNVARGWLKGADLELVAGKPLPLVTPNDLATSCREAYLGTLIWPGKWGTNAREMRDTAVESGIGTGKAA